MICQIARAAVVGAVAVTQTEPPPRGSPAPEAGKPQANYSAHPARRRGRFCAPAVMCAGADWWMAAAAVRFGPPLPGPVGLPVQRPTAGQSRQVPLMAPQTETEEAAAVDKAAVSSVKSGDMAVNYCLGSMPSSRMEQVSSGATMMWSISSTPIRASSWYKTPVVRTSAPVGLHMPWG